MSSLFYDAGRFSRYFETALGRALWAFLLREEVRIRMQAVSDVKLPALWAIEKPLLRTGLLRPRVEIAQADKPEYDMYLRMTGNMVRPIMEADGYRHAKGDVAFDGRIFQSGSSYEELVLVAGFE